MHYSLILLNYINFNPYTLYRFFQYLEAGVRVSGISTTKTKANIGVAIFSDRSYVISSIPDELVGSILFQPETYVDRSTITISSDGSVDVIVALMESRDGGLTDVLPSEGWTLKEEWSVDWDESLNKVYLKQVSAGGSVTFTSTQDRMTFAILVVKGN